MENKSGSGSTCPFGNEKGDVQKMGSAADKPTTDYKVEQNIAQEMNKDSKVGDGSPCPSRPTNNDDVVTTDKGGRKPFKI